MLKMFSSVDDWLDERRELDGAGGLWRIHDKLYDLTIWARSHPGGKFWIDTTRGTDITAAFESHHFSTKAEALLENFYRREASSPRSSETTFNENGFYKKFKRKIRSRLPGLKVEPSLKLQLISDGLAVSVLLTGLLGMRQGAPWTVASGVLLGVLAVSSHTFLHLKDNWRVHYFNMCLMSSREWKIRHVLSHHQFRGTDLDLEIPVWQPFSKTLEGLPKYLLSLFVYPVTAHVHFMKRYLDVMLSKKLELESEEIIAFLLPLFLFLFGGGSPSETFVTWNCIILIGSFIYCFLNANSNESLTRMNQINSSRDESDFGMVQLSRSGSHPKEQNSLFSFLNSFRQNALHYLCPGVGCGNLGELVPAFDEVCNESKVSYSNPTEFLEKLEKAAPEGHVFFS